MAPHGAPGGVVVWRLATESSILSDPIDLGIVIKRSNGKGGALPVDLR